MEEFIAIIWRGIYKWGERVFVMFMLSAISVLPTTVFIVFLISHMSVLPISPFLLISIGVAVVFGMKIDRDGFPPLY